MYKHVESIEILIDVAIKIYIAFFILESARKVFEKPNLVFRMHPQMKFLNLNLWSRNNKKFGNGFKN